MDCQNIKLKSFDFSGFRLWRYGRHFVNARWAYQLIAIH